MSRENGAHERGELNGSHLRAIAKTGALVLTLWAVVLAILAIMWPDPYRSVWEMVLAQMLGRGYAVVWGLTRGLPRLFVFLHVAMVDIIILLLFYPLLVGGYQRMIEVPMVGPALANIRKTAEKHKSLVEPFGAVGLAVFVFFPFWSTGALAGGVLGYLLGMHTGVIFFAVIVGELLNVAGWVWLLDSMQVFTDRIAEYLPYILGVVLVAAAVWRVITLRRMARTCRNGLPDDDPEKPQNGE